LPQEGKEKGLSLQRKKKGGVNLTLCAAGKRKGGRKPSHLAFFTKNLGGQEKSPLMRGVHTFRGKKRRGGGRKKYYFHRKVEQWEKKRLQLLLPWEGTRFVWHQEGKGVARTACMPTDKAEKRAR